MLKERGMSNRNAEVGEILLKHRSDALAIAQGKSNGKDIGTSAAEAKAALIAWKDAAVRTELTLFVSWYNNKYDTGYDSGIADERVAEFLSQLQAREEKR
jgi:hypothetical protein